MRNGERGSVRGPVREFNMLHDLPRGAAAQGHASESAGIKKAFTGTAIEGQRHFSSGRDSQNIRCLRIQFTRLRAFWAGTEQSERFSFPGGTVDDGLAEIG